MRHNVSGRKLGRTTAHRLALFRNQLASLVERERIVTTLPKAKELRPIAERVVTHGIRGSLPARRWVRRWLADRSLVRKLFDEIAPRFKERPGGYLRIVKLGPRVGDGAEMAVLEFVEQAVAEPASDEKKAKGKKGRRRKAARAADAEPAGEAGTSAAEEGEKPKPGRRSAPRKGRPKAGASRKAKKG